MAFHLKKGLILDVQAGFVDTFNWLVDFVANLKGDADTPSAEGGIHLDRTDEKNPVICGGSGGAFGIDNENNIVATGLEMAESSSGSGDFFLTLSRGRLAKNSAGKLCVENDDELMQQIPTVALSSVLSPNIWNAS